MRQPAKAATEAMASAPMTSMAGGVSDMYLSARRSACSSRSSTRRKRPIS